MVKKILYIEPQNKNKKYLYYTLLGKGLENANIDLTIGRSIDKYKLNNYNLIIFGYGACSKSNFTSSKLILNTTTPIIAFLFKLSLEKEKKFEFLKKNNIVVFGQQTRIKEFENKYKINILPTLYPFDPELFKNHNIPKIYDIGMSGALHNIKFYTEKAFIENEINIRQKIIDVLKKTKYKLFIKCSDNIKDARIHDYSEYVQKINSAKIWIATNADHGDLTPRYCEVIGCKTLLFCNEQSYSTFEKYLKDGETCVFFKNNLSNLIQKIDYYLKNPALCEKIVDNAYKIFYENFSYDKIIDKYLRFSK